MVTIGPWDKEHPTWVHAIEDWAADTAHEMNDEDMIEIWPWIDTLGLLEDKNLLQSILREVATDFAMYVTSMTGGPL